MNYKLFIKFLLLFSVICSLSSCICATLCRNSSYSNIQSNSKFSGTIYCKADSENQTGLIILDSDNLDLRAVRYKYKNGDSFDNKDKVEFSLYQRGNEYLAKNIAHYNESSIYATLGHNHDMIEIHNRASHSSNNAHKRYHFQTTVDTKNLSGVNYNIVRFKEVLNNNSIIVAIPTSVSLSNYSSSDKLFLNFTSTSLTYNNQQIKVVDKLDEKHANLH